MPDGPIDRAYVDIVPRLEEFTRRLKADTDRAYKDLDDRTKKLTEQMERRFSKGNDGIGKSGKDVGKKFVTGVFSAFDSVAGGVASIVKQGLAGALAGAIGPALGAVSAGAIQVLAAVAPATPAVGALGGAMVALKQGAIVAKLGMSGFSEAVAGNQAALDHLAPSARVVARELMPMQTTMRQFVQEKLFWHLGDDVARLGKAYMPILNREAGLTATVLNNLAEAGAKVAMTPTFRSDFAHAMRGNTRVLDTFGRAAITLLKPMLDLLITIQPLTMRFATWTRHLATGLAGAVSNARATGQLAAMWKRAGDTAAQLGRIVGELATGLFNVFRIGAADSRDLLTTVEELAAKFSDWTRSLTGQNALKKWFQDGNDVLAALGRLIKHTKEEFGKVWETTDLVHLIDVVNVKLVPAFAKFFAGMTDSGAIDDLIDATVAFLDVFSGSAALEAFAGVMKLVLEGVQSLNDMLPGAGTKLFVFLGIWKALSLIGLAGPIKAGASALISAGNAAAISATGAKGALGAYGMLVKSGAQVAASWVAQAAAAVASGATTARIWLMYRVESVKAAGAAVASGARVVASWVAQGVAAAAGAARSVAAMVVTGARYVWLGIQATASAIRMAAAWIIAMGPIAWVTAGVIALAILIIANWGKVSRAFSALLEGMKTVARIGIAAVVDFFLGMVGTIIHGAARAFGWVPGLGGKLKTAAAEFDKFRKRTNDALRGINDRNVKIRAELLTSANRAVTSGTGGGPARARAAAAGWRIPGYGGGDTVPIMAERGEAIVPKHLVPEIAPWAHERGIPGFAAGGVAGGVTVTPKLTGMPAFSKAIDQFVTVLARAAVKMSAAGGFSPNLAGVVNFARAQAGKPYVWGSAGPGGYDCCIVGDARIYGPDGACPIRDVRAGDRVFSYVEGRLEPHTVTSAWQSRHQPVFAVRTRNRTVTASANHPFMRLVKTSTRAVHRENVDWVGPIVGRMSYGSRTSATCLVSACCTAVISAGLCGKHHGRWKKHGDPRTWVTTRESYGVEWVRLDALKRGDLLVQPRTMPTEVKPDPELPDRTPVDTDVAWLLGAIIGDGNVTDKGLQLAMYGDNRDRAVAILTSRWGGHPTYIDYGFVTSNIKLAHCLTAMGMRRLGPDKRVPKAVWTWSTNLQRAFLDGYCDADGHRPANQKRHGERIYGSASRELIEDVRALHIAFGDAVSNISINRRTKPITIKGKLVKHARPLHRFAVMRHGAKTGEGALRARAGLAQWLDAGDFTVSRVLEVRYEGEQDTWDLEVEGAHNFVADGVIVHNSGFVSALTNVAQGRTPYTRRFSTGTLPAGLFAPGSGAFNIGWFTGNPGHVAATVNGVPMESRGGDGVVVGAGSRGAAASMFNQHGHLKGFARGGRVLPGDGPFDLLDKRGMAYKPGLMDWIQGIRGYARGAWDVPTTQLALLHRGEMVVPQAPAAAVRAEAATSGRTDRGPGADEIGLAVANALRGLAFQVDPDGLVRLVNERNARDLRRGPRR